MHMTESSTTMEVGTDTKEKYAPVEVFLTKESPKDWVVRNAESDDSNSRFNLDAAGECVGGFRSDNRIDFIDSTTKRVGFLKYSVHFVNKHMSEDDENCGARESFMIDDISGLIGEMSPDVGPKALSLIHGATSNGDGVKVEVYPIISITALQAFMPGCGVGSAMLTKFLVDAKEINIPIVVSAQSYFTCEDTSGEVFNEEQDKLIKFYEKNGFKSINDFVGYEYSEALIYVGNSSGEAVYNEARRVQSDFVNEIKRREESDSGDTNSMKQVSKEYGIK